MEQQKDFSSITGIARYKCSVPQPRSLAKDFSNGLLIAPLVMIACMYLLPDNLAQHLPADGWPWWFWPLCGTVFVAGLVTNSFAYKDGELRMRFLDGVEKDHPDLNDARSLLENKMIVPDWHCMKLGIPIGSTYATAANTVLSIMGEQP